MMFGQNTAEEQDEIGLCTQLSCKLKKLNPRRIFWDRYTELDLYFFLVQHDLVYDEIQVTYDYEKSFTWACYWLLLVIT